MSEQHRQLMQESLSLEVIPTAEGFFNCTVSGSLGERLEGSAEVCGQTPEHAIAIALEHLALQYRNLAEQSQQLDDFAIARSESGEAISKRYHVIVHYERIGEATSKFDACHDTLMGNTIIENAEIAVVEIAPELNIEPIARSSF